MLLPILIALAANSTLFNPSLFDGLVKPESMMPPEAANPGVYNRPEYSIKIENVYIMPPKYAIDNPVVEVNNSSTTPAPSSEPVLYEDYTQIKCIDFLDDCA